MQPIGCSNWMMRWPPLAGSYTWIRLPLMSCWEGMELAGFLSRLLYGPTRQRCRAAKSLQHGSMASTEAWQHGSMASTEAWQRGSRQLRRSLGSLTTKYRRPPLRSSQMGDSPRSHCASQASSTTGCAAAMDPAGWSSRATQGGIGGGSGGGGGGGGGGGKLLSCCK